MKRYLIGLIVTLLVLSFSFSSFISSENGSVIMYRQEAQVIGLPISEYSAEIDPSMVDLYILEPDNTVWSYSEKTDTNPSRLSTNITEKELRDKKVLYRFTNLGAYYKVAKDIKEKYSGLEFSSLSQNSQKMVRELIELYKDEIDPASKTRKHLNPKYKPMELSVEQLDAIKKLDTRYRY